MDWSSVGPTLAAIGAVIAIYFLIKHDQQASFEKVCRDRDEWEKKYLASELAREILQHENLDLIRESLSQDRETRDLRQENRDLRERLGR